MEDSKFCTNCGATLSDKDVLCPKCGHNNGASESTHRSETNRSRHIEKCKRKLTYAMVICAIICVFTLFIGALFVMGTDTIIDMLKDNPESWKQITESMSEASVKDMLALIGYTMIAGGIFAGISTLFVALKRYYLIALITCIVASIFCFIGFIAVYFIVKGKDAFTVNSKNTLDQN